MNSIDLAQVEKETTLGQIDFHPQLDSTNDQAIRLIKNGSPRFPLLVLTQQQTAGRGQSGRHWFSSTGSLTFSLSLPISPSDSSGPVSDEEPNKRSFSPALFPLLAALAVVRSIESLAPKSIVNSLPLSIKWPNDVLLNNQKVAGILIENVKPPESSPTGHFIATIGIGINVNDSLTTKQVAQSDSNPRSDSQSPNKSIFPPTHLGSHSAFVSAPGQEIDRTQLLVQIVNQLLGLLGSASSQAIHSGDILKECESRLWSLGQNIRIQRPGDQELTGVCAGLGESGELKIESDGKILRLVSGRILGRV